MKTLFSLLIMTVSLSMFSQNSCYDAKVDEFEGTTEYEFLAYMADPSEQNGFAIYGGPNNPQRYAIIVVKDGRSICVDEEDLVTFKFADGTLVDYYQYSDFNCKGTYFIAMVKKDVKFFGENRLVGIRLKYEDGTITWTESSDVWNPDVAVKIQKFFHCITQ